jgi:hypothetical protein
MTEAAYVSANARPPGSAIAPQKIVLAIGEILDGSFVEQSPDAIPLLLRFLWGSSKL